MDHSFHTPLRYPGGKGKLARYVASAMELNGVCGGTYVEPYAGGAAVAISLLLSGHAKRIHINDLSPEVHAFWHALLEQTDGLLALVNDTPVNIDTWRRMQAVLAGEDVPPLELGFATFFLNRTNRSGILNAGVIGGKDQTGRWKIDARFNKADLSRRIRTIADRRAHIHLHHEDARRLIKRLASRIAELNFFYLDPPYFQKGQDLYLNFYEEQDHRLLAGTLKTLPPRARWMLSYDAHPEIERLYRGYPGLTYTLNYTAQERTRGRELIYFAKGMKVPGLAGSMRPVIEAA
ncbi:DNA methyltransferase [Pseudoxanthomonas jiangsuensis]|nr:DNA adenine methylase [Pseudoxanthomonas jiangsuensis]KAF1698037.1 DNA methyltransferase [Pseudoxanthomonas jiangsuensis]